MQLVQRRIPRADPYMGHQGTNLQIDEKLVNIHRSTIICTLIIQNHLHFYGKESFALPSALYTLQSCSNCSEVMKASDNLWLCNKKLRSLLSFQSFSLFMVGMRSGLRKGPKAGLKAHERHMLHPLSDPLGLLTSLGFGALWGKSLSPGQPQHP